MTIDTTAEAQEPQPPPERPPCAWCAEPSVTEIYTEGNPETKHQKTAPVCAEHEKHFMRLGAPSRNAWHDEGYRKEWKKARADKAKAS